MNMYTDRKVKWFIILPNSVFDKERSQKRLQTITYTGLQLAAGALQKVSVPDSYARKGILACLQEKNRYVETGLDCADSYLRW